MNPVGAAEIRRLLDVVATRIIESRDLLTDLDRTIGDGDHGVNMARGFTAVREKLASLPENTDIASLLKTAGMTLVSTVGGASGPLYGTAFIYAAQELAGAGEMSPELLSRAMRAAANGVVKRGRAGVGDKTMLDTIEPVAAFLESSDSGGSSPEERMREVRRIARAGMESTVPMQARKGRASFLGERSIGCCDPGAMSSCIMIETALDVLAESCGESRP